MSHPAWKRSVARRMQIVRIGRMRQITARYSNEAIAARIRVPFDTVLCWLYVRKARRP